MATANIPDIPEMPQSKKPLEEMNTQELQQEIETLRRYVGSLYMTTKQLVTRVSDAESLMTLFTKEADKETANYVDLDARIATLEVSFKQADERVQAISQALFES